jgi:hypothetical protein
MRLSTHTALHLALDLAPPRCEAQTSVKNDVSYLETAAAAPLASRTTGTTGSWLLLQEVPPAVTTVHLRAAFDSARPSVPPQEAARLSALYGRFRQGGDPGWGGQQPSAGQRVTLA